MGFQDMHPIVQKFASAKGGRVRTKKGFGSKSPEDRRQTASMGGIAKRENQRKKSQEQANKDRSEEL